MREELTCELSASAHGAGASFGGVCGSSCSLIWGHKAISCRSSLGTPPLGHMPAFCVFFHGGEGRPSIFSSFLKVNLGSFRPQNPKLLLLRGDGGPERKVALKWGRSQAELCGPQGDSSTCTPFCSIPAVTLHALPPEAASSPVRPGMGSAGAWGPSCLMATMLFVWQWCWAPGPRP